MRHWRNSDYEKFDLICAMDESNKSDILSELKGKDPLKKIHLFRDFDPEGTGETPDPYYDNRYDIVFDIVDRTVKNMIKL